MPKLKWTFDKCQKEALKYTTRSSFMNNSPAYSAASKRKWLKKICSHMDSSFEVRSRAKTKWTLEACKKDAKKYKTRTSWYRTKGSGYDAAKRRGWIDQCCSHMLSKSETIKTSRLPKWTLDSCKKDAKRYKTRNEWHKAKNSGYSTAAKNDWLNQCCSHMLSYKEVCSISIKWTLEACIKDALKYKTKTSWRMAKKTGYASALKNGWLDKCCSHMLTRKQISSINMKWNLGACKKDAKKYKTRSSWSKTKKNRLCFCVKKWLVR